MKGGLVVMPGLLIAGLVLSWYASSWQLRHGEALAAIGPLETARRDHEEVFQFFSTMNQDISRFMAQPIHSPSALPGLVGPWAELKPQWDYFLFDTGTAVHGAFDVPSGVELPRGPWALLCGALLPTQLRTHYPIRTEVLERETVPWNRNFLSPRQLQWAQSQEAIVLVDRTVRWGLEVRTSRARFQWVLEWKGECLETLSFRRIPMGFPCHGWSLFSSEGGVF